MEEIFGAFPFLQNYDSLQKQQIDFQWNKLCHYELSEEILEEERTDTFWIKFRKFEFKGQKVFESLADTAVKILLITLSNAAIERRWSHMNDAETKKRCRKSWENLRAELKAYSFIKGEQSIFYLIYSIGFNRFFFLNNKISFDTVNQTFAKRTGLNFPVFVLSHVKQFPIAKYYIAPNIKFAASFQRSNNIFIKIYMLFSYPLRKRSAKGTKQST